MAANPSILGILIGLVFVSMFAGIFALTITEFGDNYSVDAIDDVDLDKYDKLAKLHAQAEKIKGNVSQVEQPSGIADILGGFFYNAYQVLASIPQSINFMYDMTNAGVDDMNLGAAGIIIRNALFTILLFVVFIGIILSILLKRDGL